MLPIFLNEKTDLASGSEFSLDTGRFPSSGLLRCLLLLVTGTVVTSGGAPVTPEWSVWRDTILPALLPTVQAFAPRYNGQLCTANLDGGYWAKLYEDKYQEVMPILVDGVPVTAAAGAPIDNSAPVDFSVTVVIPFETPKLGADRLYTCPPCSLFAGDTTLSFEWDSTPIDIGATDLTFAALAFRWLAYPAYGDNSRVPVIHRFQRLTYAQNSIDVGRGFPMFLSDNREPDEENKYNVFIDGESVAGGSLYGNDLQAAYEVSNRDTAPEQKVYTMLQWLPSDSTPNNLTFAQKSVALQFDGIASGTLDMHFLEPASGEVRAQLKKALGIPADQECIALPVTPNAAPLGNVTRKVAIAGPRTLLVGNGQATGVAIPTVPTVPAGTTGSGIARAMSGKA